MSCFKRLAVVGCPPNSVCLCVYQLFILQTLLFFEYITDYSHQVVFTALLSPVFVSVLKEISFIRCFTKHFYTSYVLFMYHLTRGKCKMYKWWLLCMINGYLTWIIYLKCSFEHNLTIQNLLCISGLPKPAPPIVGKVTHHNIELYWDESLHHAYSVVNKADGKIKSNIQEKDKFGQWSSVYT